LILVDTSVWVDHLRKHRRDLEAFLSEGRVFCHPFVIGELACGGLKNRAEVISLLGALPQATVAGHEEALRVVDLHALNGRGLGWIDVHLLTSSLLTNCGLWTNDKALAAAARSLRVDA
jgi:predicted nucleic acid-binding protein